MTFDQVSTEITDLLEVGWVTKEAFSGVTANSTAPAAITYGPLGASAVDPDIVLLRITPRQMMEIADAVDVEFSGKPQCQIIPRGSRGRSRRRWDAPSHVSGSAWATTS